MHAVLYKVAVSSLVYFLFFYISGELKPQQKECNIKAVNKKNWSQASSLSGTLEMFNKNIKGESFFVDRVNRSLCYNS